MHESKFDEQTLSRIVTIENFDVSENEPTSEADVRTVFEEFTGGQVLGVQFWASTKGSRYAFLTFNDSKYADKALDLDYVKGRSARRDSWFKWSRYLRVFRPVPTSLRKYAGPPPSRAQNSSADPPIGPQSDRVRNGDSRSSIPVVPDTSRRQFSPERPGRPSTPPNNQRSLLDRVDGGFSPFDRQPTLDDLDGYDMHLRRGSSSKDTRDTPLQKPEPDWSPPLRSSPDSTRSSEPFGAPSSRRNGGRWQSQPETLPPRQPLLRRNLMLEEKIAEAWREIKLLRTERLKQAGVIASLRASQRDLEKRLQLTEEDRRAKSVALAQTRSIAEDEQRKRLSADAALRQVEESRRALAMKLEDFGNRHADEIDKIQREADDSRRSILRRMEALEWGHKLELEKVRKRERQRADDAIAAHEREQGRRSPGADGYSLKRPRLSSFSEDRHHDNERELARSKEYAKTMELELERTRAWRRDLSDELREEVAKRKALEQRNKVLEAVPELVDTAFKLDEVMREVLSSQKAELRI